MIERPVRRRVRRDPRADIDARPSRERFDESERSNVGTRDGDGSAAEPVGRGSHGAGCCSSRCLGIKLELRRRNGTRRSGRRRRSIGLRRKKMGDASSPATSPLSSLPRLAQIAKTAERSKRERWCECKDVKATVQKVGDMGRQNLDGARRDIAGDILATLRKG